MGTADEEATAGAWVEEPEPEPASVVRQREPGSTRLAGELGARHSGGAGRRSSQGAGLRKDARRPASRALRSGRAGRARSGTAFRFERNGGIHASRVG